MKKSKNYKKLSNLFGEKSKMFGSQFDKFLHNFIETYSSDIFNNISKCKSLLLDHAKGEYVKEIRLLLQVIELNCHTDIVNSNDLNLTRMTLIKKLQNEYFITIDISSFYIDLLLSILRDYKSNSVEKEKKTTPNTQPSPNISRDYEKEAKAERFYQSALKDLFKDTTNKFTLAINNLLKAIKLCPDDKHYHYFIAYFFYKVNDNNSLDNEIKHLQNLGYDNTICASIINDILSLKQGKFLNRMENAFSFGGEEKLSLTVDRIRTEHRITYDPERIYDQYKDFDEWLVSFDEIISSQSLNKSTAYFLLGEQYYNNKDYNKAIIEFNKAIILDPNYADAYIKCGNAYTWKNDYDRAIYNYNQAIKLNPNYAKAYCFRGTAYSFKKDYDRAIDDYNQAIKLNPNYAKAYCSRGDAYTWKKGYDQAIDDYNQAIKLNPNYAEAYCSRGTAYTWKKDKQKAKKDYSMAEKLGYHG